MVPLRRPALHFYYDSNDEIIGFAYNEADYFYVKNSMGDITGITDINGNLVASYHYDPWGRVLDDELTAIGELNPFRYRSYYYDVETELYYLQSRYYDPEVGGFINSDDVSFIGATGSEISYNPFAYCENNPVNYVDYTGFSKRVTPFQLLSLLKQFKQVASNLIAILIENNSIPGFTYPNEYYEIYNSISDKKIKSKNEFINMSEVDILARVIYAGNTVDKAGQRAVALCIKNRKNKNSRQFYDKKYGNTYKGVCLKSNAFEPVTTMPDNLKKPSGKLWEHAKELATKLKLDMSISKPKGYKAQLFFVGEDYFKSHSKENNTQYKMDGEWVNIKNVKNIGGNVFFDLKT